MKNSKRFILLILTISLMLAIVSCGDSEDETIINDLFDDIYYKVVNEKIRNREKILSLLDETDYKIKEVEGLDAYKIIDKNIPEDYIFVSFSYENEEYLENISYYEGNKEVEVSFSNYSSDKSDEFDRYSTHVIGQPNEEVTDLTEQINFLKEIINED